MTAVEVPSLHMLDAVSVGRMQTLPTTSVLWSIFGAEIDGSVKIKTYPSHPGSRP